VVVATGFPTWLFVIPSANTCVKLCLHTTTNSTWITVLKPLFPRIDFVSIPLFTSTYQSSSLPHTWFVNGPSLAVLEPLLTFRPQIHICDSRLCTHQFSSLSTYNIKFSHVHAGGCTTFVFSTSVLTLPQQRTHLDPSKWVASMQFPLLTHIDSSTSISIQV